MNDNKFTYKSYIAIVIKTAYLILRVTEDGTVIKSAIKVWYITYLIHSAPKSPVSSTERRILLPLFIPLSLSLSFYFPVLSTHLNTDDLTAINRIQIQPLFSLSNKCLSGR